MTQPQMPITENGTIAQGLFRVRKVNARNESVERYRAANVEKRCMTNNNLSGVNEGKSSRSRSLGKESEKRWKESKGGY